MIITSYPTRPNGIIVIYTEKVISRDIVKYHTDYLLMSSVKQFNVQKQAWSPDLLNQTESPSVFSLPTGLWFFVIDFPFFRGLGIGWKKEFELSYVENFSAMVLTLCKV